VPDFAGLEKRDGIKGTSRIVTPIWFEWSELQYHTVISQVIGVSLDNSSRSMYAENKEEPLDVKRKSFKNELGWGSQAFKIIRRSGRNIIYENIARI
jgi:hypothetical protein